ncbi:MAG: succinate dehydrogenase, hydrophobic membrane anchor protein [Hydrotalea sp.]|nr:succinate dehydrogenase, hydrophobic membrane anchor protein [Hydrotalea sp.]
MANFFSKRKKTTRHWLGQRVSAVLMLVIAVYLASVLADNNFALPQLADLAGNGLVVVMALGFLVLFDHGKLGFEVIIEDYVHETTPQHVALFFNNAAAWVFKILTLVVAYYIFRGEI